MRKLSMVILFVYSFTLFYMPSSSLAVEKGKVVLVVMDRVGWQDILKADTPNIDTMVKKGGIGLMTTNTAGSLSQKNAYATIGAGARATGASRSHIALKAEDIYKGEKVGDIYYQITGQRVKPGPVVNLGIAQMHKNNSSRPYKVNIGALGSVLRDNGFKVAVVGNCDTPIDSSNGYKRYITSLMMDDKGIIPLGEVGSSLLTKDSTRPFGVKTNYEEMEKCLDKFWDQADLLAIQLGDTSRAEDFRYHSTEEMLEKHCEIAIQGGDAFIGKILKRIKLERDLMVLITPVGPVKELAVHNRLTPVIMMGKGIGKGWLTSGSTHRKGVITNLDIGATVLNFFGLSVLPGQLGTPAYSVPVANSTKGLIDFNHKLVEIFNQRSFLIRSYIFSLILVLVSAVVSLLFKRKYLNLVKVLLVFVMMVPLAYLLLSIFHQPSYSRSMMLSLAVAAFFSAVIFRLASNTLDRIALTCGGIAVTLILDQWTGAALIQGSPLGYDVIAGARFYGIGNEYMGVLIGAVCTGGAAIVERVSKHRLWIKAIVLFAALIALYTLGFPGLGANVGGTIAAFVSFSVTGLLIQGYKIGTKHLISIGGALTAILLALFFLDASRVVNSQTHMGQTAILIKQSGLGELLNIFKRKISMNIRLFQYTIWTRVFLASLAAIVILFFRPVGIFKSVVNQHRTLISGLIGATIGSITALVANDSGIVAAATTMIFVAPPFILLVIDQIQDKVKKGEWKDGLPCRP